MTVSDSKGNRILEVGEIRAMCPLRARLQLGLKEELDSEPEGTRTLQGLME